MQDLLMKLFMKLQGQNCLKLNGCETSECKVACGYKLPAKYVFHPMRPRDKNDYRLNDCYKSCLQKALPYNVRFIVEQLLLLHLIQGMLLKWHQPLSDSG